MAQSSERLHERRRRNRRRALIASGILLLIVCSGLAYGLSQSQVRIARVVVYGADQSIAALASETMRGKYFGLIPRDSTFFFPAARIRSTLLQTYPDVAAVSIFRSGLTSLSIKVDYRVPIARWCGATPEMARSDFATSSSELARSNLAPSCYFFDASGFLYATSSTNSPINSFVVYEPLAPSTTGTSTDAILGEVLPNAEKFPPTFDFARQMNMFGAKVDSVVFRDDEVDAYLTSGTRITYVLGDEQNAFTALESARANFDLTDGSVDYIDLRFPGKVYLNRKK